MTGIVTGVVAGTIVLAVAGLLGYRAVCQRRTARSLAISTPSGIAEARYVWIGGVDQWIQIRGEDRGNPVLLFLHGSGMSMIPFNPLFREWEKYFTVVHWDRRGVGRTLRRNGRAGVDQWGFDRQVGDGIEVAGYLREHLRCGTVILLGHSQGTIVGTAMARQQPGLFRAYVGTGQITDMARTDTASYHLAVRRARAAGNKKAAGKLAGLGAPPYPQVQTWLSKQRWSFATDPELQAWSKKALRMVLTAPGMTLRDVYHFNAGFMSYPPQPLYEETMAWTAGQQGTGFAVPFFIFQGDSDEHTLTSLAQEYFAAVQAPSKELVLLPAGGHCAVLMQPAWFLTELRTRLCPLTTEGPVLA
jgi:pimeloyl-ACP methyl ester carboxylesterase